MVKGQALSYCRVGVGTSARSPIRWSGQGMNDLLQKTYCNSSQVRMRGTGQLVYPSATSGSLAGSYLSWAQRCDRIDANVFVALVLNTWTLRLGLRLGTGLGAELDSQGPGATLSLGEMGSSRTATSETLVIENSDSRGTGSHPLTNLACTTCV